MDLGLLSAMAQGLGALGQLAGGAIAARDDVKRQELRAELNSRVIGLQQLVIQIQQEVLLAEQERRAALDKIVDLEKAATARARYATHELVPGFWVYASEVEADGITFRAPFVCQTCYDAGSKMTLRLYPGRPGHPARWACPGNSAHGFNVPDTALPIKRVQISKPFRDW